MVCFPSYPKSTWYAWQRLFLCVHYLWELVLGFRGCQTQSLVRWWAKELLLELIESGDTEFTFYGPVNDGSADIAGRDGVHAWIQGWGRNTLEPLTARFGDDKEFLGGEVGAGYALGDYFSGDNENVVLIVKHCEVEPLATGWRPPSSGGTTGSAYQNAISTCEEVLNNPVDYYLNYDGSRVDLLGFVWWHGYADACEEDFRAEYQTNLKNLLADVESEFPTLPGKVIVELGGGGNNPDAQEQEMRCFREAESGYNKVLW